MNVFVKAGQDFEEKNCFVNVNLMPKDNSNYAYQVRKIKGFFLYLNLRVRLVLLLKKSNQVEDSKIFLKEY
jgi:hypothetical protein